MKNNTSFTLLQTVLASMFAALACVATMVIKIPSPLEGYLNLGDCIILLCGWYLSPVYGLLAAGIGSALADYFSGYLAYSPATFLIKALMAVVACFVAKALSEKVGKLSSKIISGILAELVMVLGYYVFEGFMYGFTASLINIVPNLIQGCAGLILGVLLAGVFDRTKILNRH